MATRSSQASSSVATYTRATKGVKSTIGISAVRALKN
jgi:hypothetical protein